MQLTSALEEPRNLYQPAGTYLSFVLSKYSIILDETANWSCT